MTEFDCSSSGGFDVFFAYDFATGMVQGPPPENIAAVKRVKFDDGPVVLVMPPALDVNYLPVVARKTIFEVQHDYRGIEA